MSNIDFEVLLSRHNANLKQQYEKQLQLSRCPYELAILFRKEVLHLDNSFVIFSNRWGDYINEEGQNILLGEDCFLGISAYGGKTSDRVWDAPYSIQEIRGRLTTFLYRKEIEITTDRLNLIMDCLIGDLQEC